MTEKFVFQKIVYLTDTNAEGNTYFARYFDWQGMAREEFLRKNVPEHKAIAQYGIRIITTNAWMVYQSESVLFDEIEIEVNTANVKPMSLELVFTFTNKTSGKSLGRGGEKLAFASKEGELIPIPPPIQSNAQRFLIERAAEAAEVVAKGRSAAIASRK